MGRIYEHLAVKKETYELLKPVIDEFLKHNPQFKHVTITHDFIINRVFRYYLGERW